MHDKVLTAAGCVISLGPDVLRNAKKYLDELKSRTSLARRLARLAKSVQSGHLTGFVHKLAIANPIVKFLVIALAVICLMIAARKFWLSARIP